MPSAVIPRRRKSSELAEEDSDDPSDSDSAPAHLPNVNKRSRLTLNGNASVSQNYVLPDDYRSRPHSSLQNEVLHAENSNAAYQPGSIVRVKLANFVTYTAVEFKPGPKLNMVIGPNGTGKSTLVCAICLGLGWGPNHLGRAKDISEYVKHGCQEATVEIELAADGKRHRTNPVIRCTIRREGSKSAFSIDGKGVNKKAVLDLARSFSIQIDNLCQFLPQDKVVEFAAMTPVDLLHSTQRAVAPQEMLDMHNELKKLRHEQKGQQAQEASDSETLKNLENRQRGQEADVERLREREEIKQRIKLLEITRPFAQYRSARALHLEHKERKKQAAEALEKLEREVEPSLRAVNAKQEYQKQLSKVVRERKEYAESAEQGAKNNFSGMEQLQEKIDDLERGKEAEIKGSREQKREQARLEQTIVRIKKQMEEQPDDIDISSYSERIREKLRGMRECQDRAGELIQIVEDLTSQGVERSEWINRAKRDLENLDSQAGQQGKKLHQASADTAKAWHWLQEHKDKFEDAVFGPALVECSINNPDYVDAVESTLQRGDFLAFTVQTSKDYKLLNESFAAHLKLGDYHIRNFTGSLQQFRPLMNDQDLNRYGFDGWALSYLSGPELVLASLCHAARLHQTAIALRDVNDRQYEALQGSPIDKFVAGRSSYMVVRRPEYGAAATSTRVRDVRPATLWTDQPVDTSAKRELQSNIQAWEEEKAALKRRQDEAEAERSNLKVKHAALTEEKKQLEDEKSAKQKAIGEFKALPAKLAQQEQKLATAQASLAGVRQRLEELQEKQDSVSFSKGRLALEYASAVERLKEAHDELYVVEIMLIEASSDVEALSERNSSVKQMLEDKRCGFGVIRGEYDRMLKAGNDMLNVCKRLMATEDVTVQAFIRTLATDQSLEEFDSEIESEKAKLELMHEGNGGIIKEFEQRQRRIEMLKKSLNERTRGVASLEEKIKEVRDKWEPELDRLVKQISDSFGHNMEQISCAGEVGVFKDEQDFDQWAIQIQVKFRQNEPLTILDSHRQSGGERAVSTIFYLMSLQTLTRSPFRVVDEINQGMDPRNERLVHSRMVSIACGGEAEGVAREDEDGQGGAVAGGSQYFLITPKLLHGLRYDEGMRVLCIASGEYMPKDQKDVDFRGAVGIMKGLKAAAAAAAA